MTIKIGLIADIHAAVEPLKQALQIFSENKVDQVICAGDIAGYGEDQLSDVIYLLKQSGCMSVRGNHDLISETTSSDSCTQMDLDYLQSLPTALSLQYEQRKIYVVHAEPAFACHGGIKLLDQQGNVIEQRKNLWVQPLQSFDHDVLIVGHTHQVFAEDIADTMVVNPGSSLFNHSCMILSLPECEVDVFALGDQPLISCWNWGHLRASQKS